MTKSGGGFRLHFSDLYETQGTVDRIPFFIWGVILFFIKPGINLLLLQSGGKPASLREAMSPALFPTITFSFSKLSSIPFSQLLAIAVVTILFIWVGVALCVKRLKSIGAPIFLVTLFFVPFLNYLFFIILSVWPAKYQDEQGQEVFRQSWLARFVPNNRLAAAVLSVLLCVGVVIGLTLASIYQLQSYGLGLFIGVPFIAGFLAVMLWSVHEEKTFGECLGMAAVVTFAFVVIIFLSSVEGAVCIIMAAPIGFFIAVAGALLGYFLQRESWDNRPPNQNRKEVLFLVLPLFVGFSMYADSTQNTYPQYSVTTAIEINAPPEVVWDNVIAFPELPPPTSLLFRSGIAYPIGARIDGEGVGAIRYCTFSTGSFVEPIEVWDPPRLLKFAVISNPPALKELSLYDSIHPPHVENFFVSEQGQFLLVPLENGRTRIEGTTWYHNRISPDWYWKLYSDAIIHKIHTSVLEHIKRLSETEATSSKIPVSAEN